MSTLQQVLAAGIRTFTFHDHDAPVLHGIDVSFAPGTYTVILGHSGSGKSTLGRLLAGWHPPGAGGDLVGFLAVAGTRLDFTGTGGDPRINPAEWGRHVGFVPQDAAAVLSTVRATVAEELAFGLENAGVARPAMKAAVGRTAGLLGLTELLGQDPARLSGGQLRRLAIGCAIITGPSVLIMDEPFASLDAAGSAELALLVRTLVKDGTAVVILSQVIDPPLLEAGTWMVLADGGVAATGTPAELLNSQLPAGIRRPGAMSGSLPVALPGAGQANAPRTGPEAVPTVPVPAGSTARVLPEAAGAPVLELRSIRFEYRSGPARRRKPAGRARRRGSGRADGEPQALVGEAMEGEVLKGVDLALHTGEIVAVTGPNGVGKSTLLRHLNGLLRPTEGVVLVGGTDIAGTPVGHVARSVGVLFQHPRDQLFERTALREVLFGLDQLADADAAVEAGAGKPRQRALAALAAVGLERSADEHPAELPASRQRLLALATVLARKPKVLALDEPTVALDGHGLAALDAAVRSAAAEGAAVVLVTHDLGYARAAAHRTLTLDGGRLVSG